MTLRAIITETIPVGSRRRYFVGVAGTAPSGKHVYRPQFLHHGPWCKSAARDKAKRLQNDLDHDRIGHILGWFPEKTAGPA